MQKIPTLFVRDPENRRYVLDQVTPGCEWVQNGEGIPTRKFDGTCMMFDGHDWWARREVKPGKAEPLNFDKISTDPITGKTMGYEPAEQSGYWRYLNEAVGWGTGGSFAPGTYELIGPKINGNREEYTGHVVVRHGEYSVASLLPAVLDFSELAAMFQDPDWWPQRWEGVVWRHPDGRMCKIKRRDFPIPPQGEPDA